MIYSVSRNVSLKINPLRHGSLIIPCLFDPLIIQARAHRFNESFSNASPYRGELKSF